MAEIKKLVIKAAIRNSSVIQNDKKESPSHEEVSEALIELRRQISEDTDKKIRSVLSKKSRK